MGLFTSRQEKREREREQIRELTQEVLHKELTEDQEVRRHLKWELKDLFWERVPADHRKELEIMAETISHKLLTDFAVAMGKVKEALRAMEQSKQEFMDQINQWFQAIETEIMELLEGRNPENNQAMQEIADRLDYLENDQDQLWNRINEISERLEKLDHRLTALVKKRP